MRIYLGLMTKILNRKKSVDLAAVLAPYRVVYAPRADRGAWKTHGPRCQCATCR